MSKLKYLCLVNKLIKYLFCDYLQCLYDYNIFIQIGIKLCGAKNFRIFHEIFIFSIPNE
jgi:hypothetical protein